MSEGEHTARQKDRWDKWHVFSQLIRVTVEVATIVVVGYYAYPLRNVLVQESQIELEQLKEANQWIEVVLSALDFLDGRSEKPPEKMPGLKKEDSDWNRVAETLRRIGAVGPPAYHPLLVLLIQEGDRVVSEFPKNRQDGGDLPASAEQDEYRRRHRKIFRAAADALRLAQKNDRRNRFSEFIEEGLNPSQQGMYVAMAIANATPRFRSEELAILKRIMDQPVDVFDEKGHPTLTHRSHEYLLLALAANGEKNFTIDALTGVDMRRDPSDPLWRLEELMLQGSDARRTNGRKQEAASNFHWLFLNEANFGKADFRNLLLYKPDMSGTSFREAKWTGVIVEGSDVIASKNSDFYKVSLTSSEFNHVTFDAPVFSNSKIMGTLFKHSHFTNPQFDKADIGRKGKVPTLARLVNRSIPEPEEDDMTRFIESDLFDANFSDTKLDGVLFSRCNINPRSFSGAKLIHVVFQQVDGIKDEEDLRRNGVIILPEWRVEFR